MNDQEFLSNEKAQRKSFEKRGHSYSERHIEGQKSYTLFDWQKKLAPLFQLISGKTKASVFPPKKLAT